MEEATEDTKTEEAKPEVNEAKRFKAEAKRWRERAESNSERLAELEAKLNERSAADEKAEAERKKRAGEFDALEQEWQAKLGTFEQQNKTFQEQLAIYQKRDEARLESILQGREDADEIRATFEGLPIDKQLVLAEKFIASADAAPARAPSGSAGSLGGTAPVSNDLKAEAASIYPDDEEKQKIYIQQRQIIAAERKEGKTGDGWPITRPGNVGGVQ